MFPEAGGTQKDRWRLWSSDPDRHCALSSGGKDSLLTYGLLQEIGREVHPIFVNESGRHWFTALNAYRHFREHMPHTGRVWVNSDRVFNWMLRQMPFIREDFASVRSDEYPIRLWTVAVFLFGVLPLMRKHGIGRLLVGDEYDTSIRKSHAGIPHYDGLYDQSIFFDQALSRFFMRKGWAISVFSILRPLSELLIEKILAERYPGLLKLQTSCHMAHKAENRIYPCGKCEKCRRIVSMLSALGVDPTLCGYNADQIQTCLSNFTEKGLSQEEAGMRHLGWMLSQKGLIEESLKTSKRFIPQPEILKLRFNAKTSPINMIPIDLRQPLYHIFLTHAEGSVYKKGRSWSDFNVMNDPNMEGPYSFEINTGTPPNRFPAESKAGPLNRCVWGEMTWPEARDRFQQVDIALLPVGAIEQHGGHLPLDTDTFDADYLSRRVAEACSDPKPVVLPIIPYGVSYHHESFAGTLSISNDTLSRLVYEIGLAVAKNGIRKLVIINGHGGNSPALHFAAQKINRDANIFVCVDTGETSDVDIAGIIETPNDVHAGEIETSTALAVRPELVKMNLAEPSVASFPSQYLDFSSKRGVAWYTLTKEISTSGIIGNPAEASVEKGQKIWAIMIARLVDLIEDLKNMTLDQIHHTEK
jgi:creatinine amidohydrolase/Fe(II)-dependent formamide hydrolase-like protein